MPEKFATLNIARMRSAAESAMPVRNEYTDEEQVAMSGT
jgi:hypothetical protein